MADGDEASVTPPSPPNPQIGEHSFDISQIGHQNALMLQQMAGMIQNAMTQNRLENEQAMTQTRLDLEQLMNDKFASGSGEGPKNPIVNTGGGEDNTENRNPPPRTEKAANYKTFRASGTIEFFGEMDPVKAYDWIRTTEKAFRLSHTAEADKVNFASGMLKKTALEWWDSVEGSTIDTQPQGFTWGAFKERFLRKYCPTDLQDRYAKEFMELKQGKMDVTAYLAEFNKKSKFAAELVPTEARKVKRFVDGLRIEIREKLDGNVFANLDDAAEMARRREHILTIRDAELMPAPKKPRFDNSFSRSFSSNQSRSRFQPGSQARIIVIN